MKRIDHEVKQRTVLTQEQQATIATNRQIAIHRAAKRREQSEGTQEAKAERQADEKPLTEQQLQKIEKNKAKALRRAARAHERK